MAGVQQALPVRGHGRFQPPAGEGQVPGHLLREHGRVLYDPRPRDNGQDAHTGPGLPLRELQRPDGEDLHHRTGAGAAVRHLLERAEGAPCGGRHPRAQGPGPQPRPAGLGLRVLQGEGPPTPDPAGAGRQPSLPVHLQQLAEHRRQDVRQEARADPSPGSCRSRPPAAWCS